MHNLQSNNTPKVKECILQILSTHKTYKTKTLPEIEAMFESALKQLPSDSSILFLSKMFNQFKSHFITHMNEEELVLGTSTAHLHKHDDVPENLLEAIEKSLATLVSKNKNELILSLLHSKINEFQLNLENHSMMEDSIFK
ncbi:hypothetical protein OAH12_01535 [Cyclobacteriaceae bacterium]|nr:hypothetical protein [Cyclobacteriaceae bacterium]